MWNVEIQNLVKEKGQKYFIKENKRVLTFAEVVAKWQNDTDFRTFFMRLLAKAPYRAFFWETPPVTQKTWHRPFEFVLIDSPALAHVQADPYYFEKYFKETQEKIVTFPNLGKDALLVAPVPVIDFSAYPHLAAFIRHAPPSQIHALWQMVGRMMEKQLGNAPVWLSTSGLGVYWLHIRLDARPKYYQYSPYTVDKKY